MTELLLFLVLAMQAALLAAVLLGRRKPDAAPLEKLREDLAQESRQNRQDMLGISQQNARSMSEMMLQSQEKLSQGQNERLRQLSEQLNLRQQALEKTVRDSLGDISEQLLKNSLQSEQKLEHIRTTVENRLARLQDENGKKLDEMRATVDEKLQKTLEDRIGQSFKLVSERLEQVYKGLGEMQSLAAGVGDLKKVLSNVKTRGILGEIQLGAILEEILSPEQYEANIITKKGSGNFVEYAVKLPGDGETCVYLPIDAKFPADAYTQLMEAYDAGDAEQVAAAGKVLERRVKDFAKDISTKYIDPPATTDFAIMFLPVEGLYAEVVRRGLVEELQRSYRVNIAGPTTMAALLNSLQMGFKTLAIQKRSSEVWTVLGAVKTEFDKFESVLNAAQQRLEQAGSELDKLVGVRTRQIQRRLREVSALPEGESSKLLDGTGEE